MYYWSQPENQVWFVFKASILKRSNSSSKMYEKCDIPFEKCEAFKRNLIRRQCYINESWYVWEWSIGNCLS